MSDTEPRSEERPLIEIDLRENGGPVKLNSIEEAQQWVERELEFWQEFDSKTSGVMGHRNILQLQLNTPARIRQSLAEAQISAKPIESEALGRAKALIRGYQEYASLHSQNAVAKALTNTVKDGFERETAIGVLAGVIGTSGQTILEIMLSQEQKGHLELGKTLAGYATGFAQHTVNDMDVSEHRAKLKDQSHKLSQLLAQSENERDTIKMEDLKLATELKEDRDTRRKSWNEFVKETTSQVETLKNTYEEKLKLEAPANYWKEEATSRGRKAIWWLMAFAGLASCIVGTTVCYGPQFLERLAAVQDIEALTSFGIVTVPALASLWTLKQFARMLVNNLERSTQAKWRETMTTTYLALRKGEGTNLHQEDRLIILNALFRPMGVGKDADGDAKQVLDAVLKNQP